MPSHNQPWGVGGINLKQIEHYPQDDFCGTS